MRADTSKPGTSDDEYGVDDPQVFQENERGIITPAQRATLRPGVIVQEKLVTPAVPAILLLGVALFLVLGENWKDLSGALSWLPYPRLTVVLVGIAITLLVLAPKILWAVRHLPALGRDRTTGSLLKLRGTVTWQRGRFVPRTDDGQRVEHCCPRFNAAPGAYEFYVFPESRILLSMAPVSDEATRDRVTTELLGRVFGFRPEDLARHARGEATAWERLRAVYVARRTPTFLLIAFVVILPIYLALAVLLSVDWREDSSASLTFTVVAILSVVVVVGVGSAIVALVRALRSQVVTLEGPITLQEQRRGKQAPLHFYVIQGRRFHVRPAAAAAFVELTRYRVHALDRSAAILSIEAIADTPTSGQSTSEESVPDSK